MSCPKKIFLRHCINPPPCYNLIVHEISLGIFQGGNAYETSEVNFVKIMEGDLS